MTRAGTQQNLPQVVIFTDGGCEPNPGKGGWAAVLIAGERKKELHGGTLNTTNNRMEMTAAIKALEALKRTCQVQLHSDSQYLVNGITKWIHGWKQKNWRRGGKPVLNADLWQELDVLNKKHQVQWIWVRGHAGNIWNERCDYLAQTEIEKQRLQSDA